MDGFGKRLIAAREKKGFTQKKLAELLNITPTRLNYWEKDKREPDFFMFAKILDVLDADANEMLGLKKHINISENYNNLNSLGRQRADEYIDILSENEKYAENKNSISEDVVEELRQDVPLTTINIKQHSLFRSAE